MDDKKVFTFLLKEEYLLNKKISLNLCNRLGVNAYVILFHILVKIIL